MDFSQALSLHRRSLSLVAEGAPRSTQAEKAGARIATVTGARVHHPSVGELGTPMMGGIFMGILGVVKIGCVDARAIK